MSITSSVGLAGLSRKNAFVSSRTASRQAERSGPSTRVERTPKRGSHSSITQRQEPNRALAATTWSPALSWPIRAAVTAAMPVAVARAACAPSTAAIRASNMATVGLEKRP
jgi:hypothetical protein